MDFDDFDYEDEAYAESDEYEKSARKTLASMFDENKEKVFFANQLAVRHERRFFHWVTTRALWVVKAVAQGEPVTGHQKGFITEGSFCLTIH